MKAGTVNWPAVHGRVLQIDNTKFNYCKSGAGKRMGCIYQEESASFIRAGIPSQCMCGQVFISMGTKCPEELVVLGIYKKKKNLSKTSKKNKKNNNKKKLFFCAKTVKPVFRTFKSVCILMLFL